MWENVRPYVRLIKQTMEYLYSLVSTWKKEFWFKVALVVQMYREERESLLETVFERKPRKGGSGCVCRVGRDRIQADQYRELRACPDILSGFRGVRCGGGERPRPVRLF